MRMQIGGTAKTAIVPYADSLLESYQYLKTNWTAGGYVFGSLNKTFPPEDSGSASAFMPGGTVYAKIADFACESDRTYDGKIDEVRVSDINRNLSWTNASFDTMSQPENFLTFSTQEEPEVPSSFSIKGLDGSDYNITWTGTVTTTVWSNATQPGGTLELNMTVNSSDNVTEIRVYCDDLDASILASNITLYVSSDNSSFGSLGAFTDGGSNLSINTSTWNDGTMGTNPFDGAGLTDTTTSIYMRFLLVLGNDAGTYTQSDWKIYLGYYE
jgi:hypothetical protein